MNVKINPEYLEIQETSGGMALRLVKEILPEVEHRNEFSFLVRDSVSLEWGRSTVSKFCAFAYIFAMVKQWKNSPEIQKSVLEPKNLTGMVIRLSKLENLELFQQVDESIQTSIHGFSSYDPVSVGVYLKCIRKLNLKSLTTVGSDYEVGRSTKYSLAAMKNQIHRVYEKIIESVKRDNENSSFIQTLHVEPLSDKMLDTIIENYRMRVFHSADIPILIFWKILYGQDAVLGCLERYSLPNVIVNPSDFMNLLEDWEEIKSFPAEWIIHVREFKVTRD